MFLRTRWLAPMLALVLAACGEKPAEPQSLVVYTSRGDDLIRPVFDLYSDENGVKIE